MCHHFPLEDRIPRIALEEVPCVEEHHVRLLGPDIVDGSGESGNATIATLSHYGNNYKSVIGRHVNTTYVPLSSGAQYPENLVVSSSLMWMSLTCRTVRLKDAAALASSGMNTNRISVLIVIAIT